MRYNIILAHYLNNLSIIYSIWKFQTDIYSAYIIFHT